MINNINITGQRVLAAMSGGVDSSVMAALLQQAGADVIGVFMHVWDQDENDARKHGSCCALDDAYDARRVADALNIPFYTLDMREVFKRTVVEPFVQAYEQGKTPNPCANCNRFLKFDALITKADQLGAKYVATGHYVRRMDDEDGVHIWQGIDKQKDQSYFLATIRSQYISRLLFPVGNINKQETRAIAAKLQLPTASKRESQDICFIPASGRVSFLEQQGANKGLKSGWIVDSAGNNLGRHRGIARYTLGQRRGLGLSDGPWQVIALDATQAIVIVAKPEQCLLNSIVVEQLEWFRIPNIDESITIKTRYHATKANCNLQKHNLTAHTVVIFTEPQALTAPGQIAAFYVDDELVAGGVIKILEFV
ncbi:MAG: tRNA 2-thiouridine(34) synthase MnmA [Mariprofundales bacterium]